MLIVELHESSRAAADNAKRGITDYIYTKRSCSLFIKEQATKLIDKRRRRERSKQELYSYERRKKAIEKKRVEISVCCVLGTTKWERGSKPTSCERIYNYTEEFVYKIALQQL
jgi:hypothetical protein